MISEFSRAATLCCCTTLGNSFNSPLCHCILLLNCPISSQHLQPILHPTVTQWALFWRARRQRRETMCIMQIRVPNFFQTQKGFVLSAAKPNPPPTAVCSIGGSCGHLTHNNLPRGYWHPTAFACWSESANKWSQFSNKTMALFYEVLHWYLLYYGPNVAVFFPGCLLPHPQRLLFLSALSAM